MCEAGAASGYKELISILTPRTTPIPILLSTKGALKIGNLGLLYILTTART
jgi:hypothetical protein